MKRIILSFLSLLLCASAFPSVNADSTQTKPADSIPPQRKIVELGIDEKLIYVNELGLPPNTMVISALSMFPELLGRNITDILNRFDVQIDDVSVGANKYGVLAHTMISELHHIEISTDPSVSQSSNGVGGVINLITLAVEPGTSGQVSFDIYSNFNVMPSFALAYKKDKLTIYSSALLSYYDYYEKEKVTSDFARAKKLETYNNYYKGLSEAVKFGMTYQFNKRDKLTLWVIQNIDNFSDSTSKELHSVYYPTEQKNDTGFYTYGMSNINSPALHSQIDAILKFERLYDRPSQKLYASLSYSNNYAEDENNYHISGNLYEFDTLKYKYSKYTQRPHTVSSSLYYRFHLLPEECEHVLKLKTGVNYSMAFSKCTDYSMAQITKVVDDYTQNYTITPYATFYYEWRQIKAEASFKYRFKARRGKGEANIWQDNYFHDFLGNFNITYIPATNHQLRASTSRTLNTPSNLQLYGEKYYRVVENKWYQGNPDLKEPMLNNVDLQYFYQFHNSKHEFQLNAAIEYVNAQDLIVQYTTTTEHDNIVTWTNSSQTSHIIDGRLSLFWQTGIFSATFSGNFYDQIERPTGAKKFDNLFYFNLLLQPVLHFEKGWTVSGKCIYNSHIFNGDVTTGDAIYMDFNITKAWGPWSARLDFYNTYDYISTDVTKNGDDVYTRYYNLYHCQIMIGFTYMFFKENKSPKKDISMI